MLFRSIQAILFDLDGTLVDTADMILASFQYATQTVLKRAIPDKELLDMVGQPLETQMLSLDKDHAGELMEVYREHNHSIHDAYIKEFLGVKDTLKILVASGMPLAVVTSKRHQQAVRGLKTFDLDGYFDFLLGANDTTKHKPDPGPLVQAAEQLGLPCEKCLYLGDSPYDMQAARSANMLAVAATWGMFDRQRLLDAGAQRVIDSMPQLLELLAMLKTA